MDVRPLEYLIMALESHGLEIGMNFFGHVKPYHLYGRMSISWNGVGNVALMPGWNNALNNME